MTPDTRTPIAFDFETYLMEAGNLAPKAVCFSWSKNDEPGLLVNAETAALDKGIEELLGYDLIVAHNAKFDLGVIASNWPHLIPKIFRALNEGRVHDTILREKLLNLTDHGALQFVTLPDGNTKRIGYSLADLTKKYFGISLDKATKGKDGKIKGDEDSWRLHYRELDGVPRNMWSQEAVDYALEDSVWAEKIWHEQEKRRMRIWSKSGHDPFQTLTFQVCCDFALWMSTCWGLETDPENVAKLEEWVAEELKPENLNLLTESGILRPAEPPRPHARGAKDHVEGCPSKGKNQKKFPCDCPVKMTKGKKESINEMLLHHHILWLRYKDPENIKIKFTDKSDKYPEVVHSETEEVLHPGGQVSTCAEWLEEFAVFDPILQQYQRRQKLGKIVSTELPRMKWKGVLSPVVHPNYDVLKETGRTSSYSSDSFPSFNVQNVDPRARSCYKARQGFAFMSADYKGMELVTSAQTALNTLGWSQLADNINAGVDSHAFLGAQIANMSDDEFAAACIAAGCTDPMQLFSTFNRMKGLKATAHLMASFLPVWKAKWERGEFGKEKYREPLMEDFFDHYRKMAKPTGLGYPGGLGPGTFCEFARTTYGVSVTETEATDLRDLWKKVLPDQGKLLQYVNDHCEDPRWSGLQVNDKGKPIKRYCYTTPFGMHRANCSYTSCANGRALQSPGAEGAKLAMWLVTWACLDPTMGSILLPDKYGIRCRPVAFIHDEIICEIRLDVLDECTKEVCRLMAVGLKQVTPDVAVEVEPAAMYQWSKKAKDVYDEDGKLIPWEPKTAA